MNPMEPINEDIQERAFTPMYASPWMAFFTLLRESFASEPVETEPYSTRP